MNQRMTGKEKEERDQDMATTGGSREAILTLLFFSIIFLPFFFYFTTIALTAIRKQIAMVVGNG
jgi:hypothetical protein